MAAWNLAATQLPAPATYEIVTEHRGAVVTMANGAQQTDLVASGAKRTWTLGFNNLSASERSTVETAYSATVAAASVTFRDETDTARTVTLAGLEPIQWRVVWAAAGYRFSGSLKLREV